MEHICSTIVETKTTEEKGVLLEMIDKLQVGETLLTFKALLTSMLTKLETLFE